MLHHHVRTINLPSVCHYINFHKFSGGNDNSSSMSFVGVYVQEQHHTFLEYNYLAQKTLIFKT